MYRLLHTTVDTILQHTMHVDNKEFPSDLQEAMVDAVVAEVGHTYSLAGIQGGTKRASGAAP